MDERTAGRDGSRAALALGIADRMLGAATFAERWAAVRAALGELGATAVNMAAIDGARGDPHWLVSSLPAPVLRDYEAGGHWRRDLIVRHAARGRGPLIWRTAGGAPGPARPGGEAAAFAGFVRDAGTRAVASFAARSRRTGDVTCICLCSDLSAREVLAPGNLARIADAARLMLPWIDWPEDARGDGFVRYPRAELSRREAEALRLLAGGLMNARIAEAMGIAEATVAKHLRGARAKLGARTREEAVARAIRGGRLGPGGVGGGYG